MPVNLKRLKKQIEFYFSASNLNFDAYLQNLLGKDLDKEFPLSLFLDFNEVRRITSNISDIKRVLSKSDIFDVNYETNVCSLKDLYRIGLLSKLKSNDFHTRSLYLLNPVFSDSTDINLFDIKKWFSFFGPIEFCKIYKYKKPKPYAFIIYESQESLKLALKCKKLMCNSSKNDKTFKNLWTFLRSEKPTIQIKLTQSNIQPNSLTLKKWHSLPETGDNLLNTARLSSDKKPKLNHTLGNCKDLSEIPNRFKRHFDTPTEISNVKRPKIDHLMANKRNFDSPEFEKLVLPNKRLKHNHQNQENVLTFEKINHGAINEKAIVGNENTLHNPNVTHDNKKVDILTTILVPNHISALPKIIKKNIPKNLSSIQTIISETKLLNKVSQNPKRRRKRKRIPKTFVLAESFISQTLLMTRSQWLTYCNEHHNKFEKTSIEQLFEMHKCNLAKPNVLLFSSQHNRHITSAIDIQKTLCQITGVDEKYINVYLFDNLIPSQKEIKINNHKTHLNLSSLDNILPSMLKQYFPFSKHAYQGYVMLKNSYICEKIINTQWIDLQFIKTTQL